MPFSTIEIHHNLILFSACCSNHPSVVTDSKPSLKTVLPSY